MKKIAVAALLFSCFLSACESTKMKNTQSKPLVAGSKLDGTWQLDYISGPRIAFDGLYPDKKPVLVFNTADTSFSGNTGCNAFRGKLNADDSKIIFADPLAMTRMLCPGEGETVFLETLKKINRYTIQENTLTFIMGDIAMMRFAKK